MRGGGGGQEEVDLRVLHLQQLAQQSQVLHVSRQEASETDWIREHLLCSQQHQQPAAAR